MKHISYYDRTLPRLHQTIIINDLVGVKRLLLHGANINEIHETNGTPLITAIIHGSYEMMNLLLAKGANVNIKSNDELSPLHYTIITHNYHKFSLLLQYQPNLETTDTNGDTPLHYAAGDFFKSKSYYHNPDFYRVAINNNYMMFNDLINIGANLNAVNNNGYSVLEMAIMTGCPARVSFLLTNGAIINEKTITLSKCSQPIIALLIKHLETTKPPDYKNYLTRLKS